MMDIIGQDELLLIFEYLDPRSLALAGWVCKEWYWIARSNSLWQNHCLRRWHFCNLATVEPSPDIWYKYFSRRMRIDFKLETGRPGLDYKAKSIRCHKAGVLGVMYITSPKAYTNELTQKSTPDTLICSWDSTLLAAWRLSDASNIWSIPLEEFKSRKVLYDACNNQIICTCPKGVIVVYDAANGAEVRVMSTNDESAEITAAVINVSPQYGEKPRKDTLKAYLFAALRTGRCQIWDLSLLDGPIFTFYSFSNTDLLKVGSGGLIASASSTFREVKVHDVNKFSDQSDENTSFVSIQTRRHQNEEDEDVFFNAPFFFPSSHITGLCWLGKFKRFLVLATFQGVKVYDIENKGACLDFSYHCSEPKITSIEDKLLVGSNNGSLCVYTFDKDGKELGAKTYNDHGDAITGIHADVYRVLTCSRDFSVRVYKWDTTGSSIGTLVSLYTLLGGSLQYSPDGFHGLVCDYGSCIGWTTKVIKCYTFMQ